MVIHIRYTTGNDELHDISSFDIAVYFFDAVFGNHIGNTRQSIGMWHIDHNIFIQTKSIRVFLRDKTQTPYIRRVDIHDDRFVEFSFVARECLYEILNGGINDLDSRCMFQYMIEKMHQPTNNEYGGKSSHQYQQNNRNYKTYTWNTPESLIRIERKRRQDTAGYIGQQIVHEREKPPDDIDSNAKRRDYQYPLK